MSRRIGLLVIVALVASLPLAAQASSKPKNIAILVCAEDAGAVRVVAVSEGTGLPAVAAGTDCAAALVTLFGAGLKIGSVVSTESSWTYTLSTPSES